MRWDASNAEVLVFVFREGMLAAAGHDVILRVTRFEIVHENEAIRARFDPASLRVVAAMRDGRELPGAFSPADVRSIEKSVLDILGAWQWPEISFESRRMALPKVEGVLRLHGAERPIAFDTDGASAEVVLDQRAFGIRPFTAMLGALKVRPEVRIRVRVAPPPAA